MKNLLWAILLVLLGLAFPILWLFIIPALLWLGISSAVGRLAHDTKQLKQLKDNVGIITDGIKDSSEFKLWKDVWRANPTRKDQNK